MLHTLCLSIYCKKELTEKSALTKSIYCIVLMGIKRVVLGKYLVVLILVILIEVMTLIKKKKREKNGV